ncbi:MAG TPA: type I-U CRISPR-associated protein Csx17 [Streptosporangiaceae bacterium]|nr:type I-U CRISPR-associated protein Csx17 [Streptosporangiaceae bacterium]
MRTRHIFPGLRPEPLASYLAGLGLIRVLGEQADPDAAAAWAADGLAVTTDVEDMAAWLAASYVPTPVLSPWNNGSGFGAKDKEPLVRLQALREHPSSRLAPFRGAIAIAEAVVRDVRDQSWADDKKRVVLEFRNRCPEELLPWIDATVVLTGDGPVFPPLLGTGGNDGRLDFSTNFHQGLLDVIDTPRSAAMARDLVNGTETEQLANAPVGQFDPGSAGGPGSSKFGSAATLVNPWGYVLLVEGALLFASSAVRRNQFAAGRAAMPFTVSGSPDGSDSGAVGEESRGEVWAPLWSEDCTLPEIRQLFAEARASWRGRPARRASDFYAATRTLGVARGVSAFTRFGLQRRNGLAFAAVPLDRIAVRERAAVRLAAEVEDWVNRFSGDDASAAVGKATRRFHRAHLEYARDGEPRSLAAMLAELTWLALAVGRSRRAKENAPVPYAPPAAGFLKVLAEDESAELRVAVGLASCASLGERGADRFLRQLLLPVDPNGQWRDSPVIPGYGTRPLPAMLAEVLIWRCRTAADEPRAEQFRGVPTFRTGVHVPADDLHKFASSELDDTKLDLLFRACLALNWRNPGRGWSPADPLLPVPTLGVLQPLANGIRPGTGMRRDTELPSAGGTGEEPELALNPDWATRLVAGRVTAIHHEAAAKLRMAGWKAVPAPPVHPDGTRIAAALVPRCLRARSVLPVVATKLKSPESEEQ